MCGSVVAALVNGKQLDLSYNPKENDSVEWIHVNSCEGEEIIRHDSAHLLAQALKDIWQDDISIAIGPTIENGFYYDLLAKNPISEDDLENIEKRMHEIVSANIPIVRHVWSRDKALDFFRKQNEEFKVQIIQDIPEGESLSVYQQGNFFDLCRGPHAPSTSFVGDGFKLLRIAGAYWRGDSNNVMLQRIYGTAWSSKKRLNEHLKIIEEAKTRDHRLLGERAQLFFTSGVSKGSVFWMPDGWKVWMRMEEYIREKLNQNSYHEIRTPLFFEKSLWEKSGHQEKFSDSMYFLEQHDHEPPSSLKPMNCPAHIELFKKYPKTYKDLPLRFAEFGCCSRYEPSGALFGIMRLRNFTQDDAHIFCTEDQVQQEAESFCSLLFEVYKHFGFTNIQVCLSTKPTNALGNHALWERAEESLRTALNNMGIPFTVNEGEGAFYGPKLEFILQDALKRKWQCGTLQLDYILPQRLNATYTDESDKKTHPVLMHRAILGSMERFLAILIEDTKGILPMWLAPWQVAILTITQHADSFAQECIELLEQNGIRVHQDLRNKQIGFKVRAAIDKRIPFIISIGKREAESKTVSLKILGEQKNITLSLQETLKLLLNACSNETI